MARFGVRKKDFDEVAQPLADGVAVGPAVGDAGGALRHGFLAMPCCFSPSESRPLLGKPLPWVRSDFRPGAEGQGMPSSGTLENTGEPLIVKSLSDRHRCAGWYCGAPHALKGTMIRSSIRAGFMLLAVAAFLAPPLQAGASPVFCGDEGLSPPSDLTGCPSEGSRDPESLAGALRFFMPAAVSAGGRSDVSPPATVLSIAPDVYAEGEGEPKAEGEDASAGTVGAVGRMLTGGEAGLYFHLDRDGTYIYYGEPAPGDGPDADYSLEGDVPDQVGFGRRWFF
jgi:hypothetical protein